ncbi:MAG TPA: alcohol dehydrogenase catalytic domain-containing protein [Acidimicrobiia bacterium]|jgi:(R,R)-butanediol dehydrogenase/meso-butanediol dehydrogenase/diacetyl reductase
MYHGPGDVRLENAVEPKPGSGELLVQVATVGICGSDLGEYVHQPLFFPIEARHPHSGHLGPTIPGHEFSGWVIGVGSGVDGFVEGDLVAVGAGVACGACPPCRLGRTNMCQSYWTVGLHSHGGLAELVTVPASCTLNVTNSSLTPDLAALTQPMSIAVHAASRGRVAEGDVVTVLGTGGIGTFITYASVRSGATVTAVDLDPERLAVAARLGAAQTLNASDPGFEEALADLERPNVVFECTARPESLVRGLGLTADNGRLVVVGHQPEPLSVDFKLVSMGELEVIGTMAHAFGSDFPRAVEMIAAAPEAWTEVAPTVYPLDEIVVTALEPMSRGLSPQIKVLFDPSLEARRPLQVGRADRGSAQPFPS